MFIVKKPFRNRGVVLTAGTAITEPASIKRFNGRIAEGKIISVTNVNFAAYRDYFKTKHGVDIAPYFNSKHSVDATPASPKATVKTESKAEAKPAVKTVKAAAKPSVSK